MNTYNKLYSQYKKLYLSYLGQITLILNDYHKKNYSKDYWEPIIGLYLRKFILNHLFLLKINKKNLYNKINYNKINYKKTTFYKNYSEFAEDNDRYFYKFDNINKHKHFKYIKTRSFSEKINTIYSLLPNILIKFGITKIFFQESYFRKSLKFLFSARSLFYFYSLPLFNLENYKVDKKKIFQNRLNLIKIFKIKNKKDLLLQNIIFLIPINYVEYYDIILKEVKKINLSKALYVDGNEVKFDFIKFYIAELILKKKKYSQDNILLDLA